MASVVSMKLAECIDQLAKANELSEFVFNLSHTAKRLIARLLESLDVNDSNSTHHFFNATCAGFALEAAQIINEYLELEDDTIIPGIFLNCQRETIRALKIVMPSLSEIEADLTTPTRQLMSNMRLFPSTARPASQGSYEGDLDAGSEDSEYLAPRF